jgi:trans-aconitate methyltransferase
MQRPIAQNLTKKTLQHYSSRVKAFWEGTKDHDVSQNYAALMRHIKHPRPWNILDFGCGPGRDLKYFSASGHTAHGLDGCEAFCEMARLHSGCEVFCQDFISLDLQSGFYHGIFANASLFHVPKPDFTKVLGQLHGALEEEGVLFSSNPRGMGEDLQSPRYSNFMEFEEYRDCVESAGFELLEHYYRPQGCPIEECPWLACVFKKV